MPPGPSGQVPGRAFHLAARPVPSAFQDVFRLFSSSLTSTVDMRSIKVALHNAGIQLSPQEMCEALRQADLDGGHRRPCPLARSHFEAFRRRAPPLPTNSLALL